MKINILIWKSWTWKTTTANELIKRNWLEKLRNYTTRPKRDWEDNDYTFVIEEEFMWKIKDWTLIEHVFYNWYFYWIPKPKWTWIIIADPCWASQIIKYCHNNNIEFKSFYIEMKDYQRELYMKKRWDSDESIDKRMNWDWYFDLFKKTYDHIIANDTTIEKLIRKIESKM